MKHIYQRCESDCFPACIAMIAGISLQKSRELIHPNHIKGQPYSTYDSQGKFILRKLGFEINKYTSIKDFSLLKNPAIISIQLKNDDDGHVLVWDPESQKLLEPYKKYKRLPHSLYLSSIEWVWEIRRK